MTPYSYRNHLPRGVDQPLQIERTTYRPGDRVLGNASRPARTYGEEPIRPAAPAEVFEPIAPSSLDKVIAALSWTRWEDLVACLCVAAALAIGLVVWEVLS